MTTTVTIVSDDPVFHAKLASLFGAAPGVTVAAASPKSAPGPTPTPAATPTAAIPAGAPVTAPVTPPSAAPSTGAPAVTPSTAPDANALTEDKVRAQMNAFMKTPGNGAPAVKAVLAKYGLTAVKGMPANFYAQVYADFGGV